MEHLTIVVDKVLEKRDGRALPNIVLRNIWEHGQRNQATPRHLEDLRARWASSRPFLGSPVAEVDARALTLCAVPGLSFGSRVDLFIKHFINKVLHDVLADGKTHVPWAVAFLKESRSEVEAGLANTEQDEETGEVLVKWATSCRGVIFIAHLANGDFQGDIHWLSYLDDFSDLMNSRSSQQGDLVKAVLQVVESCAWLAEPMRLALKHLPSFPNDIPEAVELMHTLTALFSIDTGEATFDKIEVCFPKMSFAQHVWISLISHMDRGCQIC